MVMVMVMVMVIMAIGQTERVGDRYGTEIWSRHKCKQDRSYLHHLHLHRLHHHHHHHHHYHFIIVIILIMTKVNGQADRAEVVKEGAR